MITDWRGRRVVVMGLGRFGGGIGVARWLADQGAHVVVTDQAPEEDLRGSVAALSDKPIEMRLGRHDPADLEGCALLVVSPAVNKSTSVFFKEAVARGIPWSSEMNLFLERCPARIVGITGSVGKSTTTAMVGAILAAAAGSESAGAAQSPSWRHGRVWVGGNIGKSLLDDLPAMRADDVVVLELSSFQLEDAAAIGRSPDFALITNLRENHLDRHGTMQQYAMAKAIIYRFQRPGGCLALPVGCGVEWLPDDWRDRRPLYRYEIASGSGGSANGRRHDGHTAAAWVARIQRQGTQDQDVIEIGDLKLAVPGSHNLWNAAAALCIADMLGVSTSISSPALGRFPGLAHRLEFVRSLDGVRYFNDSKATTPEAAVTALDAFECAVVMIVGGSDKGSSFDEFGQALARRAKSVVAVGQTRERIVSAIRSAGGAIPVPAAGVAQAAGGRDVLDVGVTGRSGRAPAGGPPVFEAGDFRNAIETARTLASPGDVVVLSPGCASYDMFRNYEERGEMFRRIVGEW